MVLGYYDSQNLDITLYISTLEIANLSFGNSVLGCVRIPQRTIRDSNSFVQTELLPSSQYTNSFDSLREDSLELVLKRDFLDTLKNKHIINIRRGESKLLIQQYLTTDEFKKMKGFSSFQEDFENFCSLHPTSPLISRFSEFILF
ncbi:MAG: hypothetical protein LAT82_05070 [Nanoarchaeota archaeon]|nr:hypothetical protein [Nanoarchaeota archaeon]